MPIPMAHPSALDLLCLYCVCAHLLPSVQLLITILKQKCWQVLNNRPQLCVNSGTLFCRRQCEREWHSSETVLCMHETGDRTEKASCQSVRATMIPESRREASIMYDRQV